MEEHVLLLGQQVGHGMVGRHGPQEPERMVQVGQQTHVGVGERRLLRAEFEVVHLRRRIRTANDVQPFLPIVLVFETRLGSGACGREELTEVELVELALAAIAISSSGI